MLDTDLTFAADITDLWSYFTVLRENKKVSVKLNVTEIDYDPVVAL